MNAAWQEFLAARGAVFNDGVVEHFGNKPAEIQGTATGNVLADLSQLAFIHAGGSDAEAFLHGQFSNDLKALDRDHSQLSAYCSPKGRILALFRIIRSDDGFLLQLPAALAEPTLERLRMYVLRAEVTFRPADDGLVSVGLSGPQAERLLQDAAGTIPAAPGGCLRHDGMWLLELPGIFPRFEVIGRVPRIRELWTRIGEQALPVGGPRWAWLDIMAGIPGIYPTTTEQFVPQMANLDLLGAVNFQKGCYPGQEVVARMHYLGRLKQRMVLAHVDTENPAPPGERLYAAGSGEQAAGHVVDAQQSPQGGCDLLAVARISSYENETLHLGGADGPALDLGELPYSVKETG